MNRYAVAAAIITVPVVVVALALALKSGRDASAAGEAPTLASPATSSGASPAPVRLSLGWKRLPTAPISGRIGEGAVWSGRELIVWGGVSFPGPAGSPSTMADGAAYDPAAESWRMLSPAPPGVLGVAGPAAAWTGKVAVFWTGNSPDGPAAGAVYNPESDQWRRLPDGPLGPRESYASVWTDKELLMIGGNSGDAHADPVAGAVDPRTGSWRLLPGLDGYFGLMPSGAIWTGQEVFLTGTLALCPELGSACSRRKPIFLRYDPETDQAREVDAQGAPFGPRRLASLIPLGWTGKAIVFSTQNDPSAGLVSYEPASGKWRAAAPAPCRVGAQAAWLGDRVAFPCGQKQVQIYDLRSDTWRIVTRGASPFNSRNSSAIAWTGTDLIVWSGMLTRPGNPTPASGAALVLR